MFLKYFLLQDILASPPTSTTLPMFSAHVYCALALVVHKSVFLRMVHATTVVWDLRVNTVRGVSLGWTTQLIVDGVNQNSLV